MGSANFLDGNAGINNGEVVSKRYEYHSSEVGQSPELNVIENLW